MGLPSPTPEECRIAGALHGRSFYLGLGSPFLYYLVRVADTVLPPAIGALFGALGRLGLGRWFHEVANRMQALARRPRSGFVEAHARRSMALNLRYAAITLLTCGIGGLLALPWFVRHTQAAAAAARRGEI